MGLSTNILYYNIMKSFVDSVGANNFYIFASSLDDSTPSVNTEHSSRTFLEKSIFGKQVTTSDIRYLVRRTPWQSGVVYTQYDDSIDTTSQNFFVVVDPGSEVADHEVFKCISNNYGAVSTEMPVYSEGISLQNYIVNTADGYVWKYMYSISNDEMALHGSTTLIPVILNTNVISNAKQGIDSIIIENPLENSGYEKQIGSISSISSTGTVEGHIPIFLNTTGFNQIRGYYNGYTFYTTSPNGVTSRKYTIRDSGINTSDQKPYVSVEGYTTGDITNTSSSVWSYSITPSVDIVGDGSGASAIPVISDGRITKIQMLASGEDYTRAFARITKPVFGFNPDVPESGDVTCKLRPIIGPSDIYTFPGGHGSSPALELESRHIAVTAEFNVVDGATIPTTNSYSKVGLVRNPLFSTSGVTVFDNRIRVEISSVSGLSVGDSITQTSTGFNGVIHSIDSINKYIYITEFNGPYFDQSETTAFYISNTVDIDDAQPLTTPIGRVEIVADSVVYPLYLQNSGEVVYISDFDPIQRSPDLTEQFKFIIAF